MPGARSENNSELVNLFTVCGVPAVVVRVAVESRSTKKVTDTLFNVPRLVSNLETEIFCVSSTQSVNSNVRVPGLPVLGNHPVKLWVGSTIDGKVVTSATAPFATTNGTEIVVAPPTARTGNNTSTVPPVADPEDVNVVCALPAAAPVIAISPPR